MFTLCIHKTQTKQMPAPQDSQVAALSASVEQIQAVLLAMEVAANGGGATSSNYGARLFDIFNRS